MAGAAADDPKDSPAEHADDPSIDGPKVRTVLGDLPAADLRVTMAHEHLLMTGGWPVRQQPDFRLDSVDAAVAEVDSYTRAGGAGLVEMTPLGFGRSPDGLVSIAERTGAHIVACTGFHKLSYYSDIHWLHRYTAEQIAELLEAEIVEGMDRGGLEGPLIDRSPARAGVVKLATEYHRAGPAIARLADAVGTVHQRTGAPICTHTENGTMGHEQLDLLAASGVPSDAVVLGHIDHNPDPVYLAELASRGAFLAFDMPGRIKYAPDSQSVWLLGELAERGHTGQVLLASDLARRSYWPAFGGGPGLAYLLERFAPRARAAGLAEVLDAALVDNASRAFRLRRG